LTAGSRSRKIEDRVYLRALLVVAGLGVLCALGGMSIPLTAQGAGMFHGSSEDPAIAYSTAPLNNVVVDLNRQLQDGTVHLTFEGRSGYLRSVLEAFELPVDSQVLVFAPNSLQRRSINEANPRALFFNDRVVLGWVRGGTILEVAAHDASAGVVFYTLQQRADGTAGPPQFTRAYECLGCHMVGDSLGVPGLLMFSTTRPSDAVSSGPPTPTDQNTPLSKRFGGWFVTGSTGAMRHMGNNAAALDGRSSRELTSVERLFDADGYRVLSSDIAALLVLSHQTRMTNLLTRAGWEARAVDPTQHPPFMATPEQNVQIAEMMRGVATEVVDYMLFIDEAKLTDRVRSSSGFAERFSTVGPIDRKGRSLHELDLHRRLMKYPCSYLIYSPAFNALPPAAKDAIYKRLWQVLSGEERGARYRSAVSLTDRQAIIEILRDTQKDLPPYFHNVTQ
jgi:hypothetical protein